MISRFALCCPANCFLRLGVRRNKPFFPETPLAGCFITAVRSDKSTQRVFLGSSLGNTGLALCQPSILNTTKAEIVSLTTSPGPRVWDICIEYTSTTCRRAIFGYTMTDITKLQGLTSCNKIKSSAYVTIHPIGSDLHRWYYLNTRAFIKYICQLYVTITKHLRELTYINQKFN